MPPIVTAPFIQIAPELVRDRQGDRRMADQVRIGAIVPW
jgi:hypothetical protein